MHDPPSGINGIGKGLLMMTNIIVLKVFSIFEQKRLWCGCVGVQACQNFCWSHMLQEPLFTDWLLSVTPSCSLTLGYADA